MHRNAAEQIERAPQSPGVYLLKGAEENVLYVGKAKRLRDRLKAYVVPGRDERPSVQILVPQVETVEWLLTDNEKEALLLENSLIKTHRPRYNILLRDDKSYASLRLTRHAFPRLFVTRKIVRDGSEYFGPYSSVADLRQTLKLIQKLFQIRDCSDSFFDRRTRPCLQHQIRRCTAPCVKWVREDQYAGQIQQAKLFLAGDKLTLIERLKSEMTAASTDQLYEEAAQLRDRMLAVEGTLEPQKVESRKDERDADAIGLAGDEDATLVKILKIRRGRLISADEFFVNEPISSAPEITRAFLQQYYLSDFPGHEIPPQLLVQHSVSDAAIFESLLADRCGRMVKILQPQRGTAHRLLLLSERNAVSSLAERKRRSERNVKLLENLQRKLHLPRLPKRIEGYDISNFHGAQPVGSRVTFIDGEADKTKYRHYGIRTVKGSNDFAMLHEMFERRFRTMSEDDRPDLVLVDGGKGQLRQIVEVARDLGISDLSLASLAKEKELRSRSGRKYAPERVFLPGQKNPLIFAPSDPLLHLLQRVRDEAHRFGITHHRKARNKATLQSILSRIPGVGPKRQRALLKSLGSLERIQAASIEEISAVKGMTAPAARMLFDFFHRVEDASEE
ncbi:MAG TPA: excinuclease ABC subunit UvrC [Bdellovibrionota bacterium]|nr:excinuclease ABC subunit UvrC [Bdellovibrionota bacterium]